MTRHDGKRRAAAQLKRAIRQAVAMRRKDATAIERTGRSNVLMVGNVGSSGSQHEATASQTTHIVQTDGKTQVDTTVSEQFKGGVSS